MRQNWKPLLILALVVTAVFHLYPTIEFYSMDKFDGLMQRLGFKGSEL